MRKRFVQMHDTANDVQVPSLVCHLLARPECYGSLSGCTQFSFRVRYRNWPRKEMITRRTNSTAPITARNITGSCIRYPSQDISRQHNTNTPATHQQPTTPTTVQLHFFQSHHTKKLTSTPSPQSCQSRFPNSTTSRWRLSSTSGTS